MTVNSCGRATPPGSGQVGSYAVLVGRPVRIGSRVPVRPRLRAARVPRVAAIRGSRERETRELPDRSPHENPPTKRLMLSVAAIREA